MLSLLLACMAPGGPALPSPDAPTVAGLLEAPSLEVDDNVGTVGTVRWTTTVPGDARIEVGLDATYGRSVAGASSADGTEHAVVLAGLAADLDWHWRAVSETAGGSLASEDRVFHTAAAPPAYTRFEATTFDPDVASTGYTIIAVAMGDPGVVILDTEGRPVWWYEAEPERFVSQARVSLDGRSALMLVASTIFDADTTEIVRVPLAGGAPVAIHTPNGHHDFVELDEGGYAFLQFDQRIFEDEAVDGDAIAEMDADGTDVRTIWSLWDDRAPTLTGGEHEFEGAMDWSHCNGLVLDTETGAYLVGSLNLNAVFSVDRATGTLRWQAGGVESDLTLTSGAPFAHAHGPSLVPGGFLLFDNGDADAGDAWSEAVEYTVEYTGDASAGTWTETWRYDGDHTLFSTFLGSADRLGDGNTLIAWGAAGRLSEVAPDGRLVREIRAPADTALGYSHHVPELGGAP